MPVIPHRIKVGYRDYWVQPTSEEEGREHLGCHYGQRGIISLNLTADPPFPDIEIVNTLVHELFHAICSVHGLNLTDKMEEQVVDSLSNGWIQVLQDNPHLFNWLKDHLYDETNSNVSEDRLQEPSRIQCLPIPEKARKAT